MSSLRRTLTAPVDRFHWLLGHAAALAFIGPMVVAHVAGRGEHEALVIAFAGLLVALVATNLPPGRVRRQYGPALVAAMPLACAVHLVVPPHHPIGTAVMVLGCLAATLAPVRWPGTSPVSTAFALAFIVAPRIPASAESVVLLIAGGAVALALVVATDALRHPRLGLPALPTPRRPVADADELRRHALRVGITITLAAVVAVMAGHGSSFTSHSSWMLLGLWIALQPHAAATRDLALQRGVGTAVGAVLTVVVALATPAALWMGWVFLVLAFASFGLRTVNYAWYCVLLTPIVVLGLGGGPLDPQVLTARVAWTAAGVVLAAAASTVLWSRSPAPCVALASAPEPALA